MLLQCWARKLFDGIVSPASGILDRARNLLNVLVYLLLVGRSGNRCRSDQVNQWLDALNKEGGLVLEVVLQACENATQVTKNELVYLEFSHACVLLKTAIHANTLTIIATIRGAIGAVSGRGTAATLAAMTLMAEAVANSSSIADVR
jgi:hypothetical protein